MFLQKKAPVFEALCKHLDNNPVGFHIPGHGQGRGLPEEFISLGGDAFFKLDLTDLAGLDDLHNPRGPIARAQELAAQTYGADRSFFLVNGTTVGLQALLIAAVGNGKVLVPRNAHRAVLGGLVLSGGEPVYVTPGLLPEFGVDIGVSPPKTGQALLDHPDVKAVLAVSPNYYGITGNLDGQARAAHRADKPLLVDEAHGAHLRFHPELPRDALTAGADACVQSTHKLAGSLTQTSMLHLRVRRVDPERIAAALRLLQTTSPSYILMASLDLARRQMALQGEKLLERSLDLARWMRGELSRVKGLLVLSKEHLPEGVCLDLSRLVISVRGLGLTGYEVNDLLAKRYRVFIEMADASNVVAIVPTGATRGDAEALVRALRDIALRDKRPGEIALPEMPNGGNVRLKPRDAWFSPAQKAPLEEAKGRISAETIAVYPPGIPALNPGEEITSEVLEYLLAVRRMGLHCQGPSDETLKTVKVVIE